MMKLTLAATAALFACAPVSTPSTLAGAVHTDDLRLDRPGHIARLDLRIARAARMLCGPAPDWDLEGKGDAARCRAAARASASRQRDRLIDGARQPEQTAARLPR